MSYQVWSLETKLQIIVFQFQISSTYICGEEVALGQLPEHGFRFPVTFSPSLRVAIILGVVIQISGEEMDPTIYHCNFQQLLDLGCQSCPAYFDVLDNLNMPLYSARILPRQRDVQAAHEHSSNYPICHSWTQRYFHANDRYLAVLSGESNPKSPFECTWIKESGPAWVLDIYKNRGGSRIPSFQLIACVGIKFDSKANRIFCFHPSRPIVAICKATGIIIWRFEDQGTSEQAPSHPRFSISCQPRQLLSRALSPPSQ